MPLKNYLFLRMIKNPDTRLKIYKIRMHINRENCNSFFESGTIMLFPFLKENMTY